MARAQECDPLVAIVLRPSRLAACRKLRLPCPLQVGRMWLTWARGDRPCKIVACWRSILIWHHIACGMQFKRCRGRATNSLRFSELQTRKASLETPILHPTNSSPGLRGSEGFRGFGGVVVVELKVRRTCYFLGGVISLIELLNQSRHRTTMLYGVGLQACPEQLFEPPRSPISIG